jgi:hypothetical protein
MKRTFLFLFAATLTTWATAQSSADSTGFYGDQLSLPGVLEVFKSSSNLDGFMKSLNEASSEVNNLDLNQDGNTDFIDMRLVTDGDARALVLFVDVNEKESQDVAIIAIEKTSPKTIELQIIGDSIVYGSRLIYGPKDEVVTGGKGGPSVGELMPAAWCNVYYWPCVHWMYSPQFVQPLWTWNYGFYPPWWKPWQCSPRHSYYGRCRHWGAFYNTYMVIHCSNGWAAGLRNAQVSPLIAKGINYEGNLQYYPASVNGSSAGNGSSENTQNGGKSSQKEADSKNTSPRVEHKPTSGPDVEKSQKPGRQEPVRTGPKPSGPKPDAPKPNGPKPSGPKPSGSKPTPKAPAKGGKGGMQPAGGGKKK